MRDAAVEGNEARNELVLFAEIEVPESGSEREVQMHMEAFNIQECAYQFRSQIRPPRKFQFRVKGDFTCAEKKRREG